MATKRVNGKGQN